MCPDSVWIGSPCVQTRQAVSTKVIEKSKSKPRRHRVAPKGADRESSGTREEMTAVRVPHELASLDGEILGRPQTRVQHVVDARALLEGHEQQET